MPASPSHLSSGADGSDNPATTYSPHGTADCLGGLIEAGKTPHSSTQLLQPLPLLSYSASPNSDNKENNLLPSHDEIHAAA
jgi:hypothetical protein